MRAVRALVLALAIVAVLMLAFSGPGSRLELWDWTIGFGMLRWAARLGLAAAALALFLVLIPRTRGPRPLLLVAVIVLGLVAVAPPFMMLSRAKSLPYIHDVTTDTADPPAFVALLAERRKSPNGADYGGPEVAAAQQKGYPEIRPHRVELPPLRAFARALEAAKAMGWEIAAADISALRIEATATSMFFGFKDDVIVRVRPDGTGSRIDVRSVSRVGESDVGANARRIREFLARLT